VEGRNKPHRVPLQFPTLSAAEGWMHSPEGKDTIAEIIADAKNG
jgi:antibiotic biosynthesis monooxygenase (ABM) superfamily enzyme